MHTFIYIVDLGKKMINLFLNIPQLYIGALLVLRNAIRGGGFQMSRKKRYKRLPFNVVSNTKGWVGV